MVRKSKKIIREISLEEEAKMDREAKEFVERFEAEHPWKDPAENIEKDVERLISLAENPKDVPFDVFKAAAEKVITDAQLSQEAMRARTQMFLEAAVEDIRSRRREIKVPKA